MATIVPGSSTTTRLAIDGTHVEFPVGIPVIRQSTLSDWVSCRRLYLYRHIMGLKPHVEKRSVACDVGSFWHAIMSHAYLQGTLTSDSLLVAAALRDKVLAALQDQAATDLSGETEKSIRQVPQSCAKAQTMARIFWSKYPLSTDFKCLFSEVPLRATEGRLVIQVKPDAILREVSSGALWIMDHKSTGDTPGTAIAGKSWAFQTRLYAWAVSKVLIEPARGFVYNIMQTPGILMCSKDEKEAAKQGITPEQAYLLRVQDWYNDKPAATIRAFYVPTTNVSLPPELNDPGLIPTLSGWMPGRVSLPAGRLLPRLPPVQPPLSVPTLVRHEHRLLAGRGRHRVRP